MTFIESIKTCLKKYAVFSGRASRSEYWWFLLAHLIFGLVLIFTLKYFNSIRLILTVGPASLLLLFLPGLGVHIRRLHDINYSGWWYLVGAVPYIGFLILFGLCALPSKEPNRFNLPDTSNDKTSEQL